MDQKVETMLSSLSIIKELKEENATMEIALKEARNNGFKKGSANAGWTALNVLTAILREDLICGRRVFVVIAKRFRTLEMN